MKLRVAGSLAAWVWFASFGFCQTPARNVTPYESLTPHVALFQDVVNVGVIRNHNKALLIGSGDAAILDAAKRLGISSVDWVLYTDHHRDQCEGAARLKR